MSVNTLKSVFPLRIFIVDNSSSMKTRDGNRIVGDSINNDNKKVSMIPCTRWEELQDCIKYHINLAGLLHAPTKFKVRRKIPTSMVSRLLSIWHLVLTLFDFDLLKLLNPPSKGKPQEFSVSMSTDSKSTSTIIDIQAALSAMDIDPSGGTPLSRHVREVQKEVSSMAPQLRQAGQKVAIVIATDGMPDGNKDDFVNCLRELEGLPVWVVVRLCTDDDSIVSYYNDIDTQLELSIEVIDDYLGEAKEVHQMNPWLNYTLAIHRLREFGYYHKVFDLLDEKLLSKMEMKDICTLLFDNSRGENTVDEYASIPDPSLEWESFLDYLDGQVKKEKQQWVSNATIFALPYLHCSGCLTHVMLLVCT